MPIPAGRYTCSTFKFKLNMAICTQNIFKPRCFTIVIAMLSHVVAVVLWFIQTNFHLALKTPRLKFQNMRF